jgi:hypothetical protein
MFQAMCKIRTHLKTSQISWLPISQLLLVLFAMAGCQQSDNLQGKVTYNSEPVANGSITFLAVDGEGSGFSAKITDGSYSSDKVKLGKHTAIVRGIDDSGPLSKEASIQQREAKSRGLASDYIPEDAKGNSQSVDITGGAQTLDFELEGPPRSG